jgi:hypothetical protein
MKVRLLASLKAGLLAGLAAALVNAILFFFFRQAGVITDSVLLPNQQPMTVVPIIVSSLIPALLGSVAYYLLARFTKDGYRYFTIIASVLLILSFVNPFFGIPGVTVPYALALNVMHVVVVAALLYALRKFTAPAPDPVKP